MPEISVIVPVYKVEPYLRRCVDSILSQTFSDFELILVDDGSPDSCGAICDEYGNADSRVHVIHQENGGLSAARNAGIDWAFAHSDSRWLTFIDSDDWIHPQMLEALWTASKQSGLPVSIASFEKVYSDTKEAEAIHLANHFEVWNTADFFARFCEGSTIACAKLYQKDLFHNLRYPAGKVHEDAFLTHRVVFQTPQIAYIPKPMYWYYQISNGIMRSRSVRSLCQCSEAYEEQTLFYHENQYTKLRDMSARRMLVQKQLAIGKAGEDKDTDAVKQLKADLARQLRWMREDLEIGLSGNEYLYESVMPRRAAVSRAWRHFKMRLRKLFIR